MAQTIQIKRSNTATTPSTLGSGELAYSSTSDKLFIGNPNTSAVEAIGGKSYTDKLDGISADADETNATTVANAGALMDGEVTNLAQVKAFDSSDYATAAQGALADDALPKAGGTLTGVLVLSHSSNTANALTINNTDNGATPTVLSINRFPTDGSVADMDKIASIEAKGKNDTAGTVTYGQMLVTAQDVSNGTEDGRIYLKVMQNGTLTNAIQADADNVTINGNLQVLGTTTSVDSTVVNIGDNIIKLNSNQLTGTPATGEAGNAGLQMSRGGQTDVRLFWSEDNNDWRVETSGDTSEAVTTGILLHTANSSTATYTLDGGSF